MLSSLRARTPNAVRVLGRVRRYSTPIETTPKADETSGAPGALRPHLNIPVNPNHGLYAFFRKREKDGKATHDPLEDDAGLRDVFGEPLAPLLHIGAAFLTVGKLVALSRPSLERSRAPEKKLQGSPHPVVRSLEGT